MPKNQSKIEKLIAELCPDGVNFVSLGEAASCYSGATPRTDVAEYWENGSITWMSSGEVNKGIITDTVEKISQLGFDSCSTKMVPPNSVVIALAGQGKTRGMVAITRIALCTNQSLCSIIPDSTLDSGFLYHFLKTQYQQLRKVSSGDGTRGGLNLQMIRAYIVPLPPIAVQEEIVRILDSFTQLEADLEADLEAELEARGKQYEHYRSGLFTFGEDVKRMPMGEVGTFVRGNGLQKKDFTETGIGAIHYGQIYTYYGTFAGKTKSFVSPELGNKLKKAERGDLVIATTSENDEDVCKAVVWLGEEPIAVSGDAHFFKHKQNPKYIAYYLQTSAFADQKKKFITGTKVRRVSGDNLGKILIPVPSITVQEQIVETLDKFDALVNDISVGLPAEIKARRQQYEYYRNKLLTFTPRSQ